MPLGNPGGDFQYTFEGLPQNVMFHEIPSENVERSVDFYKNIMFIDIVSVQEDHAILKLKGSFLLIRKRKDAGVDTGIYMGVRDPFEFHRRMVDDGVVFLRHPERGPFGVYASFYDADRNILHVVTDQDQVP